MEQQITREVLTITASNPTKADKVIGARFNKLQMMALDQAERYLLYGPEDARLAITKQLVSAASRSSAADQEEKMKAVRESFTGLLDSITDVSPHLTNADVEAITARAYDQDE